MSLHDDVVQAAANCVDKFADKITLNYAQSSLDDVDKILEEAAELAVPEAHEPIAQLLGSYAFEVVRRQYDGQYKWLEAEKQPILIIGDMETHVGLVIWDKAMGRLRGDTADSIAFLCSGIGGHVDSLAPGKRIILR